MSNDPKGFVVSLPTSRYVSGERSISFQLKADGVRYFFVTTDSSGNSVRDISTQYRSLYDRMRRVHRLCMGDEENTKTKQRLREHASRFYPEFVVPDDQGNPYPWVAFPMIGAAMKQSGLPAPFGVNLQIGSGLRAFTAKDMTERIFGESPKQLQAAVAKSLTKGRETVNIDNLTLASLLRGYLPPNSMVDILSMDLPGEGLIQQIDKISANNIRLLLRRLSPHRIIRIMQAFTSNVHADMLLRDTANQYADARKQHPAFVMDLGRQFRSLEELHGTVTREYRKLENQNVEIPYSEQLTSKLESITLPGGAKLVWPSCTYELLDWASDTVMNNCIYSYGSDAVTGKSLLLAVLDGSGKMVINIMVRGKNVIQCYGKSNETVTDETLLEAVFNSLIDINVVSPENSHSTWTRQRMW